MSVAQELQVRDRLYIGGEWVEPSGSQTLDVVNASTEEVMARIPQSDAADVDRAVKAASAAFDAWSQRPAAERGELLRQVGEGLAARQEEIAATVAQELGMPIVQSRMIQAAGEFPWRKPLPNIPAPMSPSANARLELIPAVRWSNRPPRRARA